MIHIKTTKIDTDNQLLVRYYEDGRLIWFGSQSAFVDMKQMGFGEIEMKFAHYEIRLREWEFNIVLNGKRLEKHFEIGCNELPHVTETLAFVSNAFIEGKQIIIEQNSHEYETRPDQKSN